MWSWYSTTQSLCSLGPPVTTHSCLSQNSERRQGDGERKDETPLSFSLSLSFSHPCSVCLSISPEHPYPLLAEKYCLTLSHLHISSLASFCHGPSLPPSLGHPLTFLSLVICLVVEWRRVPSPLSFSSALICRFTRFLTFLCCQGSHCNPSENKQDLL